jgi:ABC-2 type transport system permease protein
MALRKETHRYLKLFIYLFVVVLVNVAAVTLFFRLDLTRDRVYSLSVLSREVVATLQEPLTVNVFFTRDLPAPYNTIERYLRDLLAEYALHANRHFNFSFHVVDPEGSPAGQAAENQRLAENYGIDPVQIQVVEQDEVKFKKAYMGMVLIHGDLVERIPAITNTDGLEYRLTTAIQKMNNKISTLLSLRDKIRVTLFLSASLEGVGRHLGLERLPEYPEKLAETVTRLNTKNYGRLEYRHVDPAVDPDGEALSARFDVMHLNWPSLPEANLAAGQGVIGLVMEHGPRHIVLPLLNVFRVPIIGTQYDLVPLEKLETLIGDGVEALVDINENLGLLAGRGAIGLAGMPGSGGRPPEALNNFNALASGTYSLQEVDLDQGPVPESLKCLMIVRPTEKFSDHDLYQIDQALMRGTNLALFLDAFQESPSMMGMPPQGAQPIDSGLEKLLAHYGVRIQPSIVLDENCFKQRLPQEMGGGERPIFFAPIIKRSQINQDLPFMTNIGGLIGLKMSPLELDKERLDANALTARQLLASSEQSWEMRERITFDPGQIGPPPGPAEMASRPLAYLIEGAFPSYFAGQPAPPKPAPEPPDDGQLKESDTPDMPTASIAPAVTLETQTSTLDKGKPAKIFLLGSSELIQDTVLEAEGRSTNAIFILNVVDHLNDRDAVALMRSKQQRFSPLEETGPAWRTFAKAFNIIGLPVLVILVGLGVWLRRAARKKRIDLMFAAPGNNS